MGERSSAHIPALIAYTRTRTSSRAKNQRIRPKLPTRSTGEIRRAIRQSQSQHTFPRNEDSLPKEREESPRVLLHRVSLYTGKLGVTILRDQSSRQIYTLRSCSNYHRSKRGRARPRVQRQIHATAFPRTDKKTRCSTHFHLSLRLSPSRHRKYSNRLSRRTTYRSL